MDPVTIPTAPPEHPILDYVALVQAGRAQLERLAGPGWTDFNSHDPGITILEAGCYALTDLGYRIFHPIPDLMADNCADQGAGLFTPSQTLTGNAVTADDLRRVVLDVKGVKNAWIEVVDQPAVRLSYDGGPQELSIDTGQPASPTAEPVKLIGLYRVLVEKSDLEDVDSASLRVAVARRLHAHRNLCEDFEDIVVLDPMPVAVFADIEIGETENGQDVLLGILERVGAAISPAVSFMNMTQALATGSSVDTIFTGPVLSRGFIDPATISAAERHQALHTSDILREIMAVPGVRAIRSISLARAGDSTGEPWSLPLDTSGAARLDLDASRIRLFKGRLPVTVDPAAVAAAYRDRARAARLFLELPLSSRDLAVPPGQDRAVADYAPLAHDLPTFYGVGSNTLPDAASDERRAQANQLRAYLTLFDQLLANEFAQLARFRSLMTADDGAAGSYASQLVGAVAPEDEGTVLPILTDGFGPDDLQTMVEAPDNPDAIRRSNRFLNHLLARAAEAITDDPRASAAAIDAADPAAQLLAVKREFLRRFPELSGGRGTSCNYLAATGATSAPALAERVRLKLGLPEDPALRFLVVEHILLRAVAEDEPNALPFLSAAGQEDPFSLQLTFVFPTALQSLAPLVETVAREETPAHIVTYVLWLDPAPFTALASAHAAWLSALRRYWLADRLGLNPDAPGGGA